MSSESSAEEVRAQYVEAMGPELGTLFCTFWNECVLLHWKWEEFVTLFGSSPERIDLLNEIASAFFRVVQDCLFEDVLIHLSRLTDPPKSSGKPNLSLRRLPPLVEVELRPRTEQLLADCMTKCTFARDWRMRRIAHSDLELALNAKNAIPLALASRKAIKDALRAIAALLNFVQEHYTHSTVMYDVHPLGNAESLLYVLRDGLQFRTLRRERLRAGDFSMEGMMRTPLP